ncbi:unnamed protein product [Symbiodinium natans]|uniref:Uncharacterized protein n=1 Tax=Symbiodinium natans TaxID=878477 RepID=A0A812UNW9_9DINO|nr:unnamed protein product [Symbiodinium natans]
MTARGRAAREDEDPDDIAACPPPEAQEAKLHFQTGEHIGRWSGFDERGVPHLNAKGKKLTKQEKELVETEYLEAKKAYQQQLKAKEQWERTLDDAERRLRDKDRVRWAYRAAGPSKHALLHVDDLEDFVKKMGWEPFSHADMEALQSVAARQGEEMEELLLEDVRHFISEEMASRFLDNRLDHFFRIKTVEDVHSPRTWRGKLKDVTEAAVESSGSDSADDTESD